MNFAKEASRPKRTRMSTVGTSWRSVSGRFNNGLLDDYEHEREITHQRNGVIDVTDARIAADVAAMSDLDRELDELIETEVLVVSSVAGRTIFREVAVTVPVRPEVVPLPPESADEEAKFYTLLGDVEFDDFFVPPPYMPTPQSLMKSSSEVEIDQLQRIFEGIRTDYEQRPRPIYVDESRVAPRGLKRATKWIRNKYQEVRHREPKYEKQPRGLVIATAVASVALAVVATVSMSTDNVSYSEKVVPTWTPPTTEAVATTAPAVPEALPATPVVATIGVEPTVEIGTAISMTDEQYTAMGTAEFESMVMYPERFKAFYNL